MEHIPLLVAFGAGLASFLSPCVLPLVPVYLASLAGPEIFEPKAKRFRISIFLHSLTFVIGFSMIFSLWGAGVGLIGAAFIDYLAIIRKISGSLLIVFGLFILVALKVPWLNYERRLNVSLGGTSGYLRSFLTGAIFCFAWTPCLAGPITGILSLAGGSGTVWHGTYLLAIYSMGLGLPFLITGAAFDTITPVLKRIYRYSTAIYIFSGVLLIVVGVLILLNRLVWF